MAFSTEPGLPDGLGPNKPISSQKKAKKNLKKVKKSQNHKLNLIVKNVEHIISAQTCKLNILALKHILALIYIFVLQKSKRWPCTYCFSHLGLGANSIRFGITNKCVQIRTIA